MNQDLDLRVAIERVHVRTVSLGDQGSPGVFVAGSLAASAGAAPHDHRIVIRELCIDIEAELDASAARGLGKQVAAELAECLTDFQQRRGTRSAGGPIHVETLRLHLRGEIARHPTSRDIAASLAMAVEERVRDA